MDQLAFHESTNPFCPFKDDHIEDLLEHLWFYGNIASSNPDKAMSRRSREGAHASIKGDDNEELWPSNLVRASSLPPRASREDREKWTLDEEIVEDEESEFSMGNLIRQASLCNSESFTPRRPLNKGLTASSSISMKTRRQGQMSQLKTQKSMDDLELYKEVQWLELKKSNEDIKAHITFWARAVASSVRQES